MKSIQKYGIQATILLLLGMIVVYGCNRKKGFDRDDLEWMPNPSQVERQADAKVQHQQARPTPDPYNGGAALDNEAITVDPDSGDWAPLGSSKGNNQESNSYSLPGMAHLDFKFKETGQRKPDSIAVVIGVKEYSHQDIPSVHYALNDAAVVKEFLVNSLGYLDGNVLFYLNPKKSELEMIFGIDRNFKGLLYDYVKPGKSDVFIYYSGHGAPDLISKQAFLVPADGNPAKIDLTCYPMEVFYKNISQIQANNITVVIDACFSGASSSGDWFIPNASPALLKVSFPKLLSSHITILSSSEADQVSSWYPQKRLGLFTYFFLKAVSGKADFNMDQKVTYQEIYRFITDRTEGVPYWARRLHGSRVQMPVMLTSQSESIFIEYY